VLAFSRGLMECCGNTYLKKKKWRKEQKKEKTRRAYIKEKGDNLEKKKKNPLNEKRTLNMLGYGQCVSASNSEPLLS